MKPQANGNGSASKPNPQRITRIKSLSDVMDLMNDVLAESEAIDDVYKRGNTKLRTATVMLRTLEQARKLTAGSDKAADQIPLLPVR